MVYRASERSRNAAQLRRQRYVQTATALVAAQGFAHATVKTIADACGTSVGSVYSYFGGRAELLAEVFRNAASHELTTVRAAVAAAGPGASDKLDALVLTFASRALAARQLAWALLFEPVDAMIDAERLRFRSAYVQLGEHVIRAGIEAGEIPSQHPGISAAALVGAIGESLVGRLSPAPAVVDPAFADTAVIAEIQNFCQRATGAHPS